MISTCMHLAAKMESQPCLLRIWIYIINEMEVKNLKWPLMHQAIEKSDLSAINKYLKEGSSIKLTHGPYVRKFEKEWSKWLGVRYSVMVNSGASANDISMKIVKEKYGKGEVIVPPLTWVSDISSVINSGLIPVFVDIDSKTLGISTDAILDAITPRTRAVFITHVLGLNALTTKLLTELKKKKIVIISENTEELFGELKNFHRSLRKKLKSTFKPEVSQKKVKSFIKSNLKAPNPGHFFKDNLSITVVIPCYGHAPYLKEMFESVQLQTRQADEVIFVVDSSPDDSYEILKKLIV